MDNPSRTLTDPSVSPLILTLPLVLVHLALLLRNPTSTCPTPPSASTDPPLDERNPAAPRPPSPLRKSGKRPAALFERRRAPLPRRRTHLKLLGKELSVLPVEVDELPPVRQMYRREPRRRNLAVNLCPSSLFLEPLTPEPVNSIPEMAHVTAPPLPPRFTIRERYDQGNGERPLPPNGPREHGSYKKGLTNGTRDGSALKKRTAATTATSSDTGRSTVLSSRATGATSRTPDTFQVAARAAPATNVVTAANIPRAIGPKVAPSLTYLRMVCNGTAKDTIHR